MRVLGVLALTASGYTVGPVAQVHRRPVLGGAPLAPAGFRAERLAVPAPGLGTAPPRGLPLPVAAALAVAGGVALGTRRARGGSGVRLSGAEKGSPKRSVILTGDRPTGPLHLGHFVGSLRSRG